MEDNTLELENIGAEDLMLEQPQLVGGAHDDFNWAAGKKAKKFYTTEEYGVLEAQYNSTMTALSEGKVVYATVTSMTEGDVVLDISAKADGLISLSEFRDIPDLRVGDRVEVYVESQEDKRGRLVLSRRKAKLLRSWESLVDSFQNGSIIKGTVQSKTKGGLIVDCSGLETFLPGSQIDIKPVTDYDSYIGKTMEFKVVKINENIKNAVISHKILIEKDLEEQREHIIAGLEKGQVLEGTVKNITDFGAFMDLGGVDGLLYITDISWGRVNHPSEVLANNQKINVVVLDFDDNKKRISLGLKQLTPHPWELVGDVTEGTIVKGKVVNVEDYGAFIEIMPGVEGLIHVSEVSWSSQSVNAKEFFKNGQEVEAKVVSIDRSDRKMSLSIKQLSADPWTLVADRFSIGSRHSGDVKNITPYGVFVELEEGIGGMVHISDLSWVKRFTHPNEFTKVGEKIEVQVLEVDVVNRKISLGHKQTEENPWENFEGVFPVGSFHEATVIRTDERGALVLLPYGLEAFSPIKNIRKEDGTLLVANDVATFKVVEFNRDEKRIMLSHTRFWEDLKREADSAHLAEKVAEEVAERKTVSEVQAKVEKSTLGDLDSLKGLKID